MTSPSVRSTSRSTPCVLGCCGPILTNISSVLTSNSMIVWSWSGFAGAMVPILSTPDPVVFQGEFVVFSERMPRPIFREQNPRQLRMAGEPDAGQVVDLALVPFGGAPQAGHRRHLRQLARLAVLPARQDHLDDEAMPVAETAEVIDHFGVRLEAGLGRLLRVRLQPVDAADAVEQVELRPRVVAQQAAHLDEVRRLDDDERVDGLERLLDAARKAFFEQGGDVGGGHRYSRET